MPSADRPSQALVVGISQYRHLGKLRKTRDAPGMRDVLASPQYCGYPPERVVLLEDDQATRTGILDALHQLGQRAAETGARSLFYFTGHGGQSADGTPYLLPVDARRGEYPGTAISARDLARLLDACRGELTVVLDCCRAAGLARPADSGPSEVELAPFTDSLREVIHPGAVPDPHATRRVLYAACPANGQSQTSSEAPYSIFTGHLLDCLRGGNAAANAGTNVTVDQLFAYVEKHVRRDSGTAQKPLFISETDSFYPLTDYPHPPRPTIEFEKDVYLSYHRDDLELEDWVTNFFQLELTHNGISLWDYDDIATGKLDVAQAIAKSRYFLMILTRSYFERPLQEFASALAVIQTLETRARRFIPILREDFAIPLEYSYFTAVDMTPRREMRFRKDMDRVIQRLKKQPDER